MFIDVEKAFDKVSWDFMKKILEEMNLILLIVNEVITNQYTIQKGTRHGCPLSPLLFVMVPEVLARNIKML